MIAVDPVSVELMRRVKAIAKLSSPVLITGETGTGKTAIARLMARIGRKGQPVALVPCPSIPPTLLRAELFGHARGAFTGATSSRCGLIEDAGAGVLILDEIGDLGADGQSAILDVIESGEYRRVGDATARKCSARIIAATLKPDALRPDLLARLSQMTIEAPPLRGRRDDIAPIAERIIRSDRDCCDLAPRGGWRMTDALGLAIHGRQWPQNVRGLQSAMRGAALAAHMGGAAMLDAHHLPADDAPQLWSARELSRQYRVSIRTMQRALSEAEARGLARRTGVARATRWVISGAIGAILARK